ncbi:cytochrome bd oxidase small subunit CydS [Neobacillus niacini]
MLEAFFIFYAPFLCVILSIAASFLWAQKGEIS